MQKYAKLYNVPYAGIAHLVERHLAKVEVASSSLVARSIFKLQAYGLEFFVFLSIFLNFAARDFLSCVSGGLACEVIGVAVNDNCFAHNFIN